MILRSGFQIGPETDTASGTTDGVDQQHTGHAGTLGITTRSSDISTARSAPASSSTTENTGTPATDDASHGSLKKAKLKTRAQPRKATKGPPGSEDDQETETTEESGDATAAKAQKARSSSGKASHGPPAESSAAAPSKGKAKVSSSTRRQNQRAAAPSKKRKTPSERSEPGRPSKRPRKRLQARTTLKTATPEANTTTKPTALTPPEDIPLPNLPECNVCWETEKEYIQTCSHPALTYTECLRNHLTASFSSKHIDQINCPDLDCSELWTFGQIKGFATAEQQATFRERKREADPNFRRCLNPKGCESGKIYRVGRARKIACKGCVFEMCFSHRTPWHKVQTCNQYDAQEAKRLQQEEKKTAVIVKPCPSCNVDIQKISGCDPHLGNLCKFSFCWACLADHQAIWAHGNHYHKRSCRHWRPPGQVQYALSGVFG
ncbi:hypothetical protein MMC30_004109 [Trapelia coarctata]|nr:hypothetical protein [Trapelia coarctata]